MATSLKKTLKADLCPHKPDAALLDIGDTTVTVEVGLTAKKDIPKTLFDRMVKVAEAKIAEYEKIIQAEVNTLEGKVKALEAKGDVKAMQAMAADTTVSVQGAGRSLQAAVEVAVKAALKVEAKGDQNLLEAKVAIGIKFSFKVISIASNLARIGASHGADLHAWKGLVTDLIGVAKIIQDLCKGESELRKELLMAIGKYCTEKQRHVIAQEKAAASKKAKFLLIVKDVYGKFKPQAEKAEASRKKYRNKVTQIRQDTDDFSLKVGKLEKAMKAAPSVKEGVAVGAKVMVAKGKERLMAEALAKAQQFADDMAMLLTEAGVQVSDATFVERLKSLQAVPDLVGFANELRKAVGDIGDIVGAVG